MSNLESEIRTLFSNHNIAVHSQSGHEATIYCIFHKNTHSPAMYINLKTGLWQCFNPSCDKRGNFRQLYKHITGRFYSGINDVNKQVDKYSFDFLDNEKELESISIDSIYVDYETEDLNFLKTLLDRGLSKETLLYLEVGYSRIKNRVVIPVRDSHYKIVGLIGRAIESSQDPRYLYNKGFKRAECLFNIQNAKKFDECIVVEGSLDCAKVIQSGFKNCVATLGSKVSLEQSRLLKKMFDKITIFSDKDEAGDAMCDTIIESCSGKSLSRMVISDYAKDPCEMLVEEIQKSYKNQITIIGGR